VTTARRTAVSAVRRAGLYKTAKRLQTRLDALSRAGRQNREQLRAAEAFYRQIVRHGDLCFDVGANHGNRVEVFRRLGARVIAVEPQQRCVDALRERFAGDLGVTIIDAGVSSSPGERDLLLASIDTLSTMSPSFAAATRASGRFESEEWSSSTRVRVTTLDDLISVFGAPAFTKIDVEGHEPEVLKGLSTALPAVSLEVVPELASHAIACIDALADLGRYTFAYGPGETFTFEWSGEPEARARTLLSELADGEFGDLYAFLAPDSG
jgi:FkbM family methyltransferase